MRKNEFREGNSLVWSHSAHACLRFKAGLSYLLQSQNSTTDQGACHKKQPGRTWSSYCSKHCPAQLPELVRPLQVTHVGGKDQPHQVHGYTDEAREHRLLGPQVVREFIRNCGHYGL